MKIAVISVPRSGHNFVMNNLRSFRPDAMVINCEGWTVDDTFHKPMAGHVGFATQPSLSTRVTPDEIDLRVVVQRGFDNWLASYVAKWPHLPVSNYEHVIDLWYDHEHAVLFDNIVSIKYERFLASPEYRRETCAMIGGEYTEQLLHDVPPPKSSFGDDRAYLQRSEQIMRSQHATLYESLIKQFKR